MCNASGLSFKRFGDIPINPEKPSQSGPARWKKGRVKKKNQNTSSRQTSLEPVHVDARS